MKFSERNDLSKRITAWMKDQQNNITSPLGIVHMVLAYLDINGYLNKVVRCKDCARRNFCYHSDDYYCADGERREDGN